MELQVEYEFRLPRGYRDLDGALHRDGVMRLATAGDELAAMRDPRVKREQEYMPFLLLSRVITRLGTLKAVTPDLLEGLYTADMNFLQNMYQTVNEAESPSIRATCPHCGKEFTEPLNFTQMG